MSSLDDLKTALSLELDDLIDIIAFEEFDASIEFWKTAYMNDGDFQRYTNAAEKVGATTTMKGNQWRYVILKEKVPPKPTVTVKETASGIKKLEVIREKPTAPIMMPHGTDSQATYKDVGNAIPTSTSKRAMDSPPTYKESGSVEPIHQQIENKTRPRETEISETKEYDLKLSREKLGALVPVLTDVNGNIIDGFHRKEIDPKWPTVSLPYIKDSVQLSMARLASNVCRREVSAEEKIKLLTNIAQLTAWDAKQIAEALGMSYTWVIKYLPEEHKREYDKSTRRVELPLKKQETVGSNLTPEPFESKSITPTVPVKELDTGFVFTCPTCERKFHLIHIEPSGRHKFEEDKGSP